MQKLVLLLTLPHKFTPAFYLPVIHNMQMVVYEESPKA